VEKGDEAERLRQLYEAGKDFTHLQLLVNTLVRQNDHRQLAIYAPILLRESKRIEDYGVAQQALYFGRQYLQVVALAVEFPDLHKLNDDFLAFEGWSLFHLGRVMEARWIARALVARRADSNDRELDVNTAIPALAAVGTIITHDYTVFIVQGKTTITLDGVQIFSGDITVPPVAYFYVTSSTGGKFEQTVISNLSATVSAPSP